MRPASLAASPPHMASIPKLPSKAVFVSRVGSFVNHAMRLPGFPALPVCAVAAIVLATTVGAFGTGLMPLHSRLQFWIALVGLNAILWQSWFAFSVHNPRDWSRSALIGGILLNAPLPFEIRIVLRLFGVSSAPDLLDSWAKAIIISAAILFVALVVRRNRRPNAAQSAIRLGGLLAKAGVTSPDALVAIRAEDHYCRVSLTDGRAPLLHHRFKDALHEVEEYDGLQVHRSHWVANAGVARAQRAGRRWYLLLIDGRTVPVSARCVPLARARGWLSRH